MPIIGKPKGYDQLVGMGDEKYVSGSTTQESSQKPMVVKETFMYFKDYEKSPNYVKAQYYLTKLVHALFPANVPDVYFSSVKDGDKITVDQRIEVVDGERTKKKDSADQDTKRKIDLVKVGFEKLDLNFDRFDWNFNIDKDGNAVYMDSFRPWLDFKQTGVPILRFNEQTAKKMIDNIRDNRAKEECLNYLQRVSVLFKAELERLEKQNNI